MKLFNLVRAALTAATLLLAAAPALAMDAAATRLGSLEISGGYARATLPNAPVGGGFLTIVNHGSADDRLVSAVSPVAGQTQLHEMAMDGGVMKMRELADGIKIPAGATVTLAPGGFHIMFMQLKQALVEGTTVPVTLTFEKAGTATVELAVGGIAAKAAPSAGMSMAPAMKPKS